ncbi:hypothetical protein CR513_27713 [Mucuna pruriens]|uniref:Uncharacterized protein n=1 Tax=Mucuna pruriens TaxID=157652 RepID=A0A371GIQ9_MUCPR|nr:hypothetical protein CR513_27713 [Mucuna pruriens]
MDISAASQYSSASESGWTNYLDQSSLSENYFQRRSGVVDYEGKGARMEESEEDLSMVSDASSGPPHYDNECYCQNWYPCLSSTTRESQKKKMVKECGRSQQPSLLDDTASSPLFNCPKESHKKQDSFSGNGAVESALDYSQCVSATRIKRKKNFQKHFSFFERSLAGKLASEEQGISGTSQVFFFGYYSQTLPQMTPTNCMDLLENNLDIWKQTNTPAFTSHSYFNVYYSIAFEIGNYNVSTRSLPTLEDKLQC